MEKTQIVDVLKSCDLFEALDENELAGISGICTPVRFNPGDRVFAQGDTTGRLYVISEGFVRLERTVDLGGRNASVTVDLLGPGRAFGCWPALIEEAHSLLCSAVCTKSACALSIDGPPLREMMAADKTMGYRVLDRLCRILRSRMSGVYGAMEKL